MIFFKQHFMLIVPLRNVKTYFPLTFHENCVPQETVCIRCHTCFLGKKKNHNLICWSFYPTCFTIIALFLKENMVWLLIAKPSSMYPQHMLLRRNKIQQTVKWTFTNFRNKYTFGLERPVKLQISLLISAVWSESSLDTLWILGLQSFLSMLTMKTDQTVRMSRLIWVFIGCMSEGMFSRIVAHLE